MDLPDPPASALPEPAHLLFAYGTLMLATGIPDVDSALRDAGPSLGRGWIPGRLFDLGEYPGAVAPEDGAGDEDAPKVWGRLMHLKDPAAFYSVIDRYEGFDASDTAGSEFVRATARMFLPGHDRGIVCQVYWYNLSVRGKPVIHSGDYLAYWLSRGKPSQGRRA